MKIATKINESIKSSIAKAMGREFFNWATKEPDDYFKLDVSGYPRISGKGEDQEIDIDDINVDSVEFIHDKTFTDDLEESDFFKDYKVKKEDVDEKDKKLMADSMKGKFIFTTEIDDVDLGIEVDIKQVDYDKKKDSLIIKKYKVTDVTIR